MLESVTRVRTSIRSLGTNWLVSSGLVVVALWCASTRRIPGSYRVGLCLLLLALAFLFSIQCLRWELRAIAQFEAGGIEASYWYLLIPFGIIFLVFGIALETGLFLLYAHYTLHHYLVQSRG